MNVMASQIINTSTFVQQVFFQTDNSYQSSALMMTSSNGNIFRVTGPLCGEFTVSGEFPAQRPVTQSFDVFFDLCLNKQWWGWWFETYRAHYDVIVLVLCDGMKLWTGGYSSQRTSEAENVLISWCHHALVEHHGSANIKYTYKYCPALL